MTTEHVILVERLRMTFRQLPAALRVGTVLAICCCVLFFEFVDTWLIITWLAIHSAITLIRYFSLRGILTDSLDTPASVIRYSHRYTLTAVLLGLTWSALALLIPFVSYEYQIVIFVLLIGISFGALTANVGHMPSFYGYVIPLFSIFTIQLLLREWFVLSMLMIVYTVYISIAALKLQRSLIHSIKLRFESEASTERLNEVMQELEIKNKYLEQIAAIDKLTGLANRRSFDSAIAREWNRTRRNQTGIALLMIDIDHFKRYNDHYHHQQGDAALQQVALVLKRFARRPGDIIARYGGEEFALIISDTTTDYVAQTAEEIRQAVEALEIPNAGHSDNTILTVSVGTCLITSPKDDDYSDLIRAADRALYEAKQAGRNRVYAA